MQTATSSIRAGAGTSTPLCPTNAVTPARLGPSTSIFFAEPLRQTKYRKLTRKHLGSFLGHLFAEFTGLHFYVVWVPSTSPDWNAGTLPAAGSVRCLLARTHVEAQPACRTCGPRQLARVLNAGRAGHRFICRFGVRNCWLPIRVQGMTVGIAYLQALTGQQLKPLPPRRSAGAETKTVSPSEFLHASRLFRLIVQHVETLDLAELLRQDLTKARQALRIFAQVQTRLRKELTTVLPALRNPPPVPRPETHRKQLVQVVLDHIHHHCAQPLTLQKCARELRVNAAYLSHLFSDTVGLPFKTCLTEVRIEKARELLSDPAIPFPESPAPSATPAQTGSGSRSERSPAFHPESGARRCR